MVWGPLLPSPVIRTRDVVAIQSIDSGLDVVVEAVDTTPSVPSFLNNILGFFYHRHTSFSPSLWSKILNVTSLKKVLLHEWRYPTLGRCKIGKYTFPSKFSNIFLTYQTFVSNLHLLRVELRCKLPGKLRRVTGPLAHHVVLNHTFEFLINSTMLFWYIWNEHFNKKVE